MQTYRVHCFDPLNKPEIIRVWEEVRETKNPIKNSSVKPKRYTGTFVEYTFVNKKGKRVYVEEYCVLVKWEDVK